MAKSSVGFQSSPEQLLLSSVAAVLFDAEVTGLHGNETGQEKGSQAEAHSPEFLQEKGGPGLPH